METRPKLLEIINLEKHYPIKSGPFRRTQGHVKAVDGISFDVHKGETLGIVGESGSGKTTLGRTIVRLLDPTDGKIIFEGNDLSALSNRQLASYRKDMQMVFQDPFASLNPRMTVKQIIEEPIATQKTLPKKERRERVEDLLEIVGLPEGAGSKHPHEFSGGQRQRIGIARALSNSPKFVIADEPVSSLDVSIQAQILNVMNDLQDEFDLTYLFIAHDLSVIKHISDRILIMYLGKMAEIGSKNAIYSNPLHPYTQALLSAVPVPKVGEKRERIKLKGDPPSPANPPSGCVFHTRCPFAYDRCKIEVPLPIDKGNGHLVSCHLYDE